MEVQPKKVVTVAGAAAGIGTGLAALPFIPPEAIAFCKEVGFPAFVAWYLLREQGSLLRGISERLSEMTQEVRGLRDAFANLSRLVAGLAAASEDQERRITALESRNGERLPASPKNNVTPSNPA